MYDNKFCSFIKNRRISLNLSFRDAAQKAGLSHSYLHRLEKGDLAKYDPLAMPPPSVLLKLSKAYSVDYNFLMGLIGYLDDGTNSYPSTDVDIELTILEAINKLDSSESLVMFGSTVNKADWDKLREIFLFNIEYMKMMNKSSEEA